MRAQTTHRASRAIALATVSRLTGPLLLMIAYELRVDARRRRLHTRCLLLMVMLTTPVP